MEKRGTFREKDKKVTVMTFLYLYIEWKSIHYVACGSEVPLSTTERNLAHVKFMVSHQKSNCYIFLKKGNDPNNPPTVCP